MDTRGQSCGELDQYIFFQLTWHSGAGGCLFSTRAFWGLPHEGVCPGALLWGWTVGGAEADRNAIQRVLKCGG